MTRPRSQLVSLEATPYYHCISRCVRRAFLCGEDRFSGKSFDHRKPWLVERLALLTDIFTIDIVAYAVMSNHYHVVLHVDEARIKSLSDTEVITRWTRLYKGTILIQRLQSGETLSCPELETARETIAHMRRQLSNISRFMACMNEFVARKANKEDGCTGRFWEGRFKSQALLDEAALASCMAYVDLNPIRAGISSDLINSDYTSVQDRLGQLTTRQRSRKKSKPIKKYRRPRLLPFGEGLRESDSFASIPFNLKDYLELVDWTGRVVRANKKGSIDQRSPTLLNHLRLTEGQWRVLALDIQKQSILMFNGLEKLACLEKVARKAKAA